MITAKRLKQCRVSANETLEQVGQLVGVHKTTVRRWETGETERIALPTIQKLAIHYNVSPAWLMGADVPMERNHNSINSDPKNDHTSNSHTKKKRPMTLSEKVRRKRIEAGLSIEDLSKASGINIDELKQCELGNITPTISKNLSNLAKKALNVEPVELLPDSTDNDLYKVADYNNNKIKQLTSDEKTLLDNYRDLNNKGKEKLIDYSDDLKGNSKYSDEHKK